MYKSEANSKQYIFSVVHTFGQHQMLNDAVIQRNAKAETQSQVVIIAFLIGNVL